LAGVLFGLYLLLIVIAKIFNGPNYRPIPLNFLETTAQIAAVGDNHWFTNFLFTNPPHANRLANFFASSYLERWRYYYLAKE
jgi:hypothetical protein